MENKSFKLFVDKFKSFDKKKLLVIFGVIGILLIAFSNTFSSNDNVKSNESKNYDVYIENLEKQTEDIISSIYGVGKCKVMLTLDETDENVYAKNIDEKTGSGSFSKNSEYVLYEDNNDDSPVLIKQYFPRVKGVVVVCQGGDNELVREKIISAISSLYGLSSNKISVSRLNR